VSAVAPEGAAAGGVGSAAAGRWRARGSRIRSTRRVRRRRPSIGRWSPGMRLAALQDTRACKAPLHGGLQGPSRAGTGARRPGFADPRRSAQHADRPPRSASLVDSALAMRLPLGRNLMERADARDGLVRTCAARLGVRSPRVRGCSTCYGLATRASTRRKGLPTGFASVLRHRAREPVRLRARWRTEGSKPAYAPEANDEGERVAVGDRGPRGARCTISDRQPGARRSHSAAERRRTTTTRCRTEPGHTLTD